ncbi:uncharacterized protein BJX67DRAFT_211177 [Aspergillus lucknowensis]|uniref:Wings apart-like protein C-terminal domain-containing protein n=1 Tax=Aspergillus lucknowensis TaxID=176173 RepID=A0ABR4M2B0_9EURO
MPPTRSATSRRTRNSTTKALDFVNSVMDPKGSTTEVRQTQSSRPVRQLRNMSRAPRRDIWEIPNSPERTRRPNRESSPLATAPLTPRHSTRLQNRLRVQNSPVVAGKQAQATGVGHQRTDVKEEDSYHEESGNSSVEKDKESTDHELEDAELIGNFNLFSDDAGVSQSPSIRFPSPSAFLNQDLERIGQFEAILSKTGTPERVTQVRAGEKHGDGRRSTSSRSTPNAAAARPSVVIHNSPNKVLETPIPSERPAPRHLRRRAEDNDGVVDMGSDGSSPSNGHENAAAEDMGSVYETPDQTDQTSSSASSVSTESSLSERRESSLPATPSGKLRPPPNSRVLRSGASASVHTGSHKPVPGRASESPGSDFRWSTSPGQLLDRSTNSRRAVKALALSSHESRPRSSAGHTEHSGSKDAPGNQTGRTPFRRPAASSNKEPTEREIDYPRCKEAMNFGEQQSNWKHLIKDGRKMGRRTHPTIPKHFQDIVGLITHLQQWYENLHNHSGISRDLYSEEARKNEKLLDSISREGNLLLDEVYYKAVQRKETSRDKARRLFQEFEASVLPAMIRLVFTAFDAYHIEPKLFPDTYNHLHRILSLLLRFCNRMRSLIQEQYVRCATRSKDLLAPLERLIEASESDALRNVASDLGDRESAASVPSDDDEDLALRTTQKPFTDAEGLALLDGLQQHHGTERYVRILRDFDKLEGRTIRELRDKAQEAYDRFVPLIQDQLETPEGREEWRWLLSVRE